MAAIAMALQTPISARMCATGRVWREESESGPEGGWGSDGKPGRVCRPSELTLLSNVGVLEANRPRPRDLCNQGRRGKSTGDRAPTPRNHETSRSSAFRLGVTSTLSAASAAVELPSSERCRSVSAEPTSVDTASNGTWCARGVAHAPRGRPGMWTLPLASNPGGGRQQGMTLTLWLSGSPALTLWLSLATATFIVLVVVLASPSTPGEDRQRVMLVSGQTREWRTLWTNDPIDPPCSSRRRNLAAMPSEASEIGTQPASYARAPMESPQPMSNRTP